MAAGVESIWEQLANAANLALAFSILALTAARQIGSRRPEHARSWAFFGLAAITLLVHASLDLAGGALSGVSRLAEVATTALLSVAFIFLYGADRDGIERVKDAADHDHLTGLFNLRAFNILAAERLGRALENQGRCAVAVLDLDGFKSVNDVLGHQAGDRVLQLVGRAIRTMLRPHDLAARYGGDEFVLLLDRCDAHEARRVCERLLGAVVMLSAATGPQVSFSCGLSFAPENGSDLSRLIQHADAQLIGVKRAGKNAVSAAAAGQAPVGAAGSGSPQMRDADGARLRVSRARTRV